MTNFLVEHNLPFAVTDHLSPLLRNIFSDSDIAKNYACARTKTASMINGAIAPFFQGTLTTAYKYKYNDF